MLSCSAFNTTPAVALAPTSRKATAIRRLRRCGGIVVPRLSYTGFPREAPSLLGEKAPPHARRMDNGTGDDGETYTPRQPHFHPMAAHVEKVADARERHAACPATTSRTHCVRRSRASTSLRTAPSSTLANNA